MEIGELVSALMSKNATDPYCDGKKNEKKGWKAKINKWGSVQNCSGTQLYSNMSGQKKDTGFLGPPNAFVAKKPPADGWAKAHISPSRFPIQAHHIIPKNHLPTHPVCTFLAAGYTQHATYQLTEDTPYDTDHANNGYCLPYATPLAEWKKARGDDAEKLKLCFFVMRKTRRQLHQGSHKAAPYDTVADDEEPEIHIEGYLSAVNIFLEAVQVSMEDHLEECNVCKKKKSGGKIEIQPVPAVVRHMDQVSGIIKLLVDANITFISEPASLWGKDKQVEPDLPDWLGDE
ncbi:MAG: hypothetical protein ACYDAE_09360 [Steroidobacteraceae bacterium]